MYKANPRWLRILIIASFIIALILSHNYIINKLSLYFRRYLFYFLPYLYAVTCFTPWFTFSDLVKWLSSTWAARTRTSLVMSLMTFAALLTVRTFWTTASLRTRSPLRGSFRRAVWAPFFRSFIALRAVPIFRCNSVIDMVWLTCLICFLAHGFTYH